MYLIDPFDLSLPMKNNPNHEYINLLIVKKLKKMEGITKTSIYMVRHGDSPKSGKEKTRGLTEKGKLDVQRITDVLQGNRCCYLKSIQSFNSNCSAVSEANRTRSFSI